MEEEIVIGGKKYKFEDFYALTDERFQKIFKDVSEMERTQLRAMESKIRDNLVNQIIEDSSKSLGDDYNKLAFLQGINRKLQQIDIRKEKDTASINDYTITPLDDADIEYNDIINGLDDAYEIAKRKVEEEITNTAVEEENLMNEIENDDSRELSEEAIASIKRVMEKKEALRKSYKSMSNEAELNKKAINDKYVPKHLAEKKLGFFTRLLDRLSPKRVEKREYKDKQGRLSEIIKSIPNKIKAAEDTNRNRNIKIRGKAIGAALLASFSMLTATSIHATPQEQNYIEPKAATVDQFNKDLNFTAIDKVADLKVETLNGTVKIEGEAKQSKVNQMIDAESALYEESENIYEETDKRVVTLDQIRTIVDKYFEIDSMDISNAEKTRLINDYLNDDSDGLTREEKLDVITITKDAIERSSRRAAEREKEKAKEQAAPSVQVNKPEVDIPIVEPPVAHTETNYTAVEKDENTKHKTETENTSDSKKTKKNKKTKKDNDDVLIDDTNSDQFVDVDEITEDEQELIDDFYAQNEDLTNGDIPIVDVSEQEGNPANEMEELPIENASSEENQNQVAEHTKYDDIVYYDGLIDSIMSTNMPADSLKYTLTSNFDGVLNSADISNILSSDASFADKKNQLKALVLQKYLGEEYKEGLPQSFSRDYETVDAIFASCPRDSLCSTLKNNIENLDDYTIDQIFSDSRRGPYIVGVGYSKPDLSVEEYKAEIKAALDYSYKVYKLDGDAKKAYEIIVSIERTDMHGANKSTALISALRDYINENELNELYNEVFNYYVPVNDPSNMMNSWDNGMAGWNQPQSNVDVIIYTDPDGSQYAIVDGIRHEADDQFFRDMQEQGVTYAYDDGMGNNSFNINYEDIVLSSDVYTQTQSKEEIFIERLKEKCLEMGEERTESYNVISKYYMMSRTSGAPSSEHDRIFNQIIDENMPKDMPGYIDMVNKGLINRSEITTIIYDDTLSKKDKIERISAIIDNAQEEYTADPDKQEVYKTIKEASKIGYGYKIDDIAKEIPLNDMCKIGVLSIDDLRKVATDPIYTDAEREKIIRDKIKEAEKTMEKTGYYQSQDYQKWKEEHDKGNKNVSYDHETR